jgi:hypothetical protein
MPKRKIPPPQRTPGEVERLRPAEFPAQQAQEWPVELDAGAEAAPHHDLVRHGTPRLAVQFEEDCARPGSAQRG